MNDTLVVRSLVLERDALLALHARAPQEYPALFESVAAGTAVGRFDILFAAPGATLTLRADGTLASSDASLPSAAGFLATLDRWWSAERAVGLPPELPFHGGWLLFLGYELAGQIEPRLRLPVPERGPVAAAMRVRAAVVYEHASGTASIVGEEAALVARIEQDLHAVHELPRAPCDVLQDEVIEDPPEEYRIAVRRALDYIAAGDIYQANLSRAWRATLAPGVTPDALYRRLRHTNPGP